MCADVQERTGKQAHALVDAVVPLGSLGCFALHAQYLITAMLTGAVVVARTTPCFAFFGSCSIVLVGELKGGGSKERVVVGCEEWLVWCVTPCCCSCCCAVFCFSVFFAFFFRTCTLPSLGGYKTGWQMKCAITIAFGASRTLLPERATSKNKTATHPKTTSKMASTTRAREAEEVTSLMAQNKNNNNLLQSSQLGNGSPASSKLKSVFVFCWLFIFILFFLGGGYCCFFLLCFCGCAFVAVPLCLCLCACAFVLVLL